MLTNYYISLRLSIQSSIFIIFASSRFNILNNINFEEFLYCSVIVLNFKIPVFTSSILFVHPHSNISPPHSNTITVSYIILNNPEELCTVYRSADRSTRDVWIVVCTVVYIPMAPLIKQAIKAPPTLAQC